MATADDLRRIALAFPGAEEQPHFDRRAFRGRRIFATLAPDQLTANLMLTPDEQEMQVALRPAACAKLPNKWGDAGATCVTLAAVDVQELQAMMALAWAHAAPAPRKPRGKTPRA
ncbi:MAG: MmcQ/YjbR family DNA-binding protein [Paracoccaceae bacterium]